MRSKMHILLGVVAAFVLMLGANLNNYAIAEDQEDKKVGLTVSPSIDMMGDLKPGETYERSITAENPSDETIAFKVLVSSFWIEGDDYKIKWGVSESQHGKIAEWTDIDQTKVYEVAAGESYTLDYNLTVPEDQAGGAQHLMVTISMGSNGEGGFIATEMNLNTLIYATVEGDVEAGAEIVSNAIQGFSFVPSASTNSVVKNTGNVDLNVKYMIYASSFFSGEQAFMTEEDKMLIVDSTRMYEQVWTDAPQLGIFNLTQEITIMGEVHTFTGVVVICPLWLIVALAIAIVMMTVYVIYRYNFRKKHRRS
ncbi:MAG: hypothetical protein ACK5MU_00065 [Candidatus Saccharimonadales bacterium]